MTNGIDLRPCPLLSLHLHRCIPKDAPDSTNMYENVQHQHMLETYKYIYALYTSLLSLHLQRCIPKDTPDNTNIHIQYMFNTKKYNTNIQIHCTISKVEMSWEPYGTIQDRIQNIQIHKYMHTNKEISTTHSQKYTAQYPRRR